jgi:hypothetical protein
VFLRHASYFTTSGSSLSTEKKFGGPSSEFGEGEWKSPEWESSEFGEEGGEFGVEEFGEEVEEFGVRGSEEARDRNVIGDS